MASNAKAGSFEYKSDALESYVDSEVGVLHFKNKVFELSVDFSLQSILFERIKIASESDDIKVLLMMSSHSAVGEERSYRFLKNIVDARDGIENSGFHSDIDPLTALSRVDSTLNQFILTMLQYNKFVVAAIRGSVVSEFLGTILAADHRIVSEDTVFSFPHIRWGLPPRGAIGYLLPRYIGFAAAKRILLQGKPIDASRAEKLNLVDSIVPADSFEERCIDVAKKFTTLPANIVAKTKTLLAGNIKALQDYLKLESEMTNIYQVKLPPEFDNK